MRPVRSFLFIAIFFACLAGLYILLPGRERFEEFISGSGPSVFHEADNDSSPTEGNDSLSVIFNTEPLSTKPVGPLLPFIDSLKYSRGQVRVMYYGDSQVEGDRISGKLRELLREEGGGTGPGLFLPVMPVMYTESIWIQSSSNWNRYTYVSYNDGVISNNRFGPLMVKCRYLAEGDSVDNQVKATVKVKPSNLADTATACFERLRIFYNCEDGPVSVNVVAGNTLLLKDTLPVAPGVHETGCELYGVSQITIEFEGRYSPDIYGISIESDTGVVVDNIPLRGSAGLEFTMVDNATLNEWMDMLQPDLIVLQYGLNIVRNVRDEYSYYRRGIVRQIDVIKRASPAVPVLIVGVTNMADVVGDSIKPFDNIKEISRAQKEAAEETGAVFWDAYEEMGGSGSVADWVAKRLMQTDYTHLTYAGADTVALMIARDLFMTDTFLFVQDTGKETDSTTTVTGVQQEDTLHTAVAGEQREVFSSDSTLKRVADLILRYDSDRPMVYNGLLFWIFFFVVMALYGLFYRKTPLRNIYLLLMSLFFYYKTGGLFLLLLLLAVVANYMCGRAIATSGRRTGKKIHLAAGVIFNLAILAYFKYSSFFIGLMNDTFGTGIVERDYLAQLANSILGAGFNVDNIILPVGISFFLFQAISYIVDVYRGDVEPVRNILDFGFYLSFFPQLVAGPIVRASEFIPQMSEPYNLGKREFGHALFLISKGLIKKIIISDFLALNFVDRVFDMPAAFSGFENLMAVYGYSLQIYCDFSGYTDIAIGLALLLGFRIPVNFNSPYKALDLTDFWRRWHISLSRWLKDYLYIPLGGNRKGRVMIGVNLIVTMLLGGLWHGASIKFVIWGGLHGIGLIFSKIKNRIFGEHRIRHAFFRFIPIFITFNFVSFAWIFFRSEDMSSALLMFSRIFQNFSPGDYLEVIPAYLTVFILMLAGYTIHLLPERVKESYRGLFINFPVVVQFVIMVLVVIWLYLMQGTEVMPFIYFRF